MHRKTLKEILCIANKLEYVHKAYDRMVISEI